MEIEIESVESIELKDKDTNEVVLKLTGFGNLDTNIYREVKEESVKRKIDYEGNFWE